MADRKIEMKYLIGLDLGATNAKGAVIDELGRVLAFETRALGNELQVESIVSILAVCARQAVLASGVSWSHIIGVGVGTPGAVIDDGYVTGSGNLGWHRVPLKWMMADALGLNDTKVVVLNDADAAIHAELWVGAASRRNSAALLTLGTGVGCGIAVFGKVVTGTTSTMEGGHMIIVQNGRQCACGGRGCLEAHASATAIASDYQERTGKMHLTCAQVFTRAANGDTTAQSVIDDAAQAVAIGCVNLIRLLDPDVVILAGGVATQGNGFLHKVRKYADELKWTCLPSRHNIIVLAAAGVHTGCLGAAKAARDAISLRDNVTGLSRRRSEPSCFCFSSFSPHGFLATKMLLPRHHAHLYRY